MSPRETLEEALIEVNRLFQAEQKVREQLEVAYTVIKHDRDRWHKAFLDAKYPDVLPTRVAFFLLLGGFAFGAAVTRAIYIL